MRRPTPACPDCDSGTFDLSRREFLRTAGAVAAGAAAVGSTSLWTGNAMAAPAPNPPETTVKMLYETLTPAQKEKVCFAWDHVDPKRGLLRTRISNNWHITEPTINGDFYTKDQQKLLRQIYEGII